MALFLENDMFMAFGQTIKISLKVLMDHLLSSLLTQSLAF